MQLHIDPPTLDILTPAERLQFVRFGVGPEVAVHCERIHHAFESHARRNPTAVAVSHLGVDVTYGELDRRAEEVASLLTHRGVVPGDHVGLFLRRSIDMVVGILGVLKAGAAYVPQDVRIAPPRHLEHIMRTTRARVVLTLAEYATRIPPVDGVIVVSLDTQVTRRARPASAARAPSTSPTTAQTASTSPRTVAADPTAVVIFTSGTTGSPNGVSVTHANLCNIMLAGPGALGITAGMKVAQTLNIAFDMAAWEIFGALSHGATLVIRGRDIEATARRVDVLIATPSILGSLDPDRCRNVRIVAVAGERCPQGLADTWSTSAAFYNSCGPTEVTIVNTLDRYEPGKPLTIGRPLPNNTVYILDEELRPCPVGAVGEMWAGGSCVTAGYLGNDDLTRERYLPDPFLGGGHRMFRTRDLASWTPDGQLLHHGRTDDQVKVHGFRVELDAVTGALESAPGCVHATTLLHDGELVSFVAPASVDVDAARRAVARTLPYYYTPTAVLALSELPRTERGKIDKGALRSRLDGEFLASAAAPVLAPVSRIGSATTSAYDAPVAAVA